MNCGGASDEATTRGDGGGGGGRQQRRQQYTRPQPPLHVSFTRLITESAITRIVHKRHVFRTGARSGR